MKDYVLNKKPEPASNEIVWAFDLGNGSSGDPINDLQPGTVAQASAPAGCGSVPLPVHVQATTRGGTPLEPQCQAEVRPGTAALPSNDLQPVSQEALIGAIKKCHQTLWAGGKLSPSAALGI